MLSDLLKTFCCVLLVCAFDCQCSRRLDLSDLQN